MRNPLATIFKPVKPVAPPAAPSPINFSYGAPQDEKPWPIWQFFAYMILLSVLWLVAKPIVDELVTQLVDPLSIAGYMHLLYNSFVWILFIGLAWIGFRKTFKGR